MAVDKGDPQRWAVLLIFCVYSASNAIQWITYAPIATAVKEFFHLTTNQLNWLSSVYMIVFAVGAYLTCTTFERWGVRRGVLVGCSLNALGSILKLAPGIQVPQYTVLIVSQTLNSVAQLFVLSTPPLIAAQYFAPQHRAFATAIAATANNVGNAIALFTPPLIVRKGVSREFYLLFGVQAGLCCGVLLFAFLFLKAPAFQAPSSALLGQRSTITNERREEPDDGDDNHRVGDSNDEDELFASPTAATAPAGKAAGPAPSAVTGDVAPTTTAALSDASGLRPRVRCSADAGSESKKRPVSFWRRVQNNEEVITFLEVGHTVYRLCRNRDFLFLLIAFSISVGSVWTYSSVLAQILEPFGLSATMAGIAGALNVLAGVIMAYLVGLWVDRKRKYKKVVIVCLCGSVVTCLGLMALMLKGTPGTNLMVGLSVFIYVFAGAFQGTATPISFEFAMEITYPLPESVPGAMLMAGANVVSLILLSVASEMLGNGVPSKMQCVYVVVLIIAVCAVGAVLSFFPRERLHRRAAEVSAQEQLAEMVAAERHASAITHRSLALDVEPVAREGERTAAVSMRASPSPSS